MIHLLEYQRLRASQLTTAKMRRRKQILKRKLKRMFAQSISETNAIEGRTLGHLRRMMLI
jgi:hypothetical protein